MLLVQVKIILFFNNFQKAPSFAWCIISDRLQENSFFLFYHLVMLTELKKKRNTQTDGTQWVRWLFFLLLKTRTGIKKKKRVIKEQRTMDALRLFIFINSSKAVPQKTRERENCRTRFAVACLSAWPHHPACRYPSRLSLPSFVIVFF